jgi:hypothetical protein
MKMEVTTKALVYILASILVPLILMQFGLAGWFVAGLVMAVLGFYLGVVGRFGLKESVFLAGSSLGIFLMFEALLGLAKPYGLPAEMAVVTSLDVLGAFLYFVGAMVALTFMPVVKK